MVRGLTQKDQRLLDSIRKYDTHSPDQCVQIWHEVRNGMLNHFPPGFLQKYEHRVAIVRAFVDEHRKEKPGTYPKYDDFSKNKLSTVMKYCDHSPYLTFKEAGFSDPKTAVYDHRLAEMPWTVLEMMPLRYWKSKRNRISATRWLVEKTGKPSNQIMQGDFANNGLMGLMLTSYDTIFDALSEAGYEINPVNMNKVANGFWKRKENRIKYTRWLVDNLKKPITKIDNHDWTNAGLGSLLQVKKNSPYLALREAGYKVKPWQMSCVPHGYWNNAGRRRRFIRRLVRESGKRPEELTSRDFKKPMKTVLSLYYRGSVILALKDAGYDVDPIDMYRVPCNTWKDPENVRRAAERISKKTGKAVTELTTTDFKKTDYAAIDGAYRTPELQTILREGSAVSL